MSGTTAPPPPEPLTAPRRARRSIALTFLVHGAVTGSFVTRIPWIQHHLDLSAGQLGLALVMPAVGSSSPCRWPAASCTATAAGPRCAG